MGTPISRLQQHGEPKIPADLAARHCLGFTGLHSYPEWKLTRAGEKGAIRVQSRLVSNDNEAQLCAARIGVGILAGGDWLMTKDLREGRLARVLPEWQLDADTGVYLVRPSARFNTATTTAFKEWIEGAFAEGAPWMTLPR